MKALQVFVLALALAGAVFAVAPLQVYDYYGYDDYGYYDDSYYYGSNSGCCCGSGAILAALGGVALLKRK